MSHTVFNCKRSPIPFILPMPDMPSFQRIWPAAPASTQIRTSINANIVFSTCIYSPLSSKLNFRNLILIREKNMAQEWDNLNFDPSE